MPEVDFEFSHLKNLRRSDLETIWTNGNIEALDNVFVLQGIKLHLEIKREA